MTITDKPKCRRRLWADVDGLLCSETKPHTPGIACRFVSEGQADQPDHHREAS